MGEEKNVTMSKNVNSPFKDVGGLDFSGKIDRFAIPLGSPLKQIADLPHKATILIYFGGDPRGMANLSIFPQKQRPPTRL